ncbi:MAG: hypothetical protein C0600_10170, partial [Ignavibacteria bacterium]
DRSTNYFLGDLGSGTGTLPGSGYDGLVNFDDLVFFAGVYRKPRPHWTGTDAEANFGPAVEHKSLGQRFGIPEPDNKIHFEDLMLLALNYNSVPKRSPVITPPADAMALELRSERDGDELIVTLHLANDGQPVKGLSVELRFDPYRMSVKNITRGLLFGPESPHAFFHAAANGDAITIDGALLGTGAATSGSGCLAKIRFADIEAWDNTIEVGEVLLRDINNHEIPFRIERYSNVDATPHAYRLQQNIPNPFTTATEIRFQIPEQELVTIEIHDMLGTRIATLVEDIRAAGMHAVTWSGRDISGVRLPTGPYVCTMRVGSLIMSKVMLLQR